MRPLWTWRPAILRRAALVVYLPITCAWMALCAVLSAAWLAFGDFLWDVSGRYLLWQQEIRCGCGRAWIVATWRGENVGEALVREMDRRDTYGT